jgi:F0F1-type ATP synthase gamma subunit
LSQLLALNESNEYHLAEQQLECKQLLEMLKEEQEKSTRLRNENSDLEVTKEAILNVAIAYYFHTHILPASSRVHNLNCRFLRNNWNKILNHHRQR